MRTSPNRRALIALSIACLVAIPSARGDDAPATAPTTAEANGAAERRGKFLVEQRAFVHDILTSYPTQQPARRLDELGRVELVDGNLVCSLAPGLPAEGSCPTVAGTGAAKWNTMRGNSPVTRAAFGLESNVLREGPGEPTATHVQLNVTPPANLLLSLDEQSPDATASAQLVASTAVDDVDAASVPTVTLHFNRISETDEPDGEVLGRFQLTAPSFAALVEQHHDEVVIALGEAFASLRASHLLSGLTEPQLRQVLATDAPRDANVDREVQAVLDALRKDGDDAIDAVRKRLADAGAPAAIALAAADRRGWSPDLALHVDTVLADALPLAQQQARQALASPARLVDALYWPDAGVRKAVKARLATTKSVDATLLGAFDPAKDPYEQAGTIETLRAALLRAKEK